MSTISMGVQMTLDGVISGEEEWMMFSEDIFKDYLEYYNSVDLMIFGANTYAALADHWQNAENSKNDLERALAKRINEVSKVVLSTNEIGLKWRNSSQLLVKDTDSFLHGIEKLKKDAHKIAVEGGVTTWQRFVEHDLYDELWLLVHPVIVSKGEKLFDHAKGQAGMNLSRSRKYDNGVVGLWYQKKV